MTRRLPALALLLLLAAACGGSATAANVRVDIPPIAGQTGVYDWVEIDQAAQRLYLTDRTDHGVDVFDVSRTTPRFLKTIPVKGAPNGLALAKDVSRLFVGLSGGSVAVIDIDPGSAKFQTVIDTVATGGTEADLLDYSSERQRVYVSNGPDGIIASIDPTTDLVKARFNVGHTLEQPRYNRADDRVYVTSTDDFSLYQVDPNDGKVKNKYSLGSCTPAGMAINAKGTQALIACNGYTLGWDFRSKRSHVFGDVPGGDIVTYDAKADKFFIASPHTTTASVIGVFGGDPIGFQGALDANAKGNSAAYDEASQRIYSPDARPNNAGLFSFVMPTYHPPGPDWLVTLVTLAIFLVPLAALVLAVYLYGRRSDRRRRARAIAAASAAAPPRPAPVPAVSPTPTQVEAPRRVRSTPPKRAKSKRHR